MRRQWKVLTVSIAALVMNAGLASAQASAPSCGKRQSFSDFWSPGPMITPSANTLPRKTWLYEPYVINERTSATHTNELGSLWYVFYGLTDKDEFGPILYFPYKLVRDQPSSPGVGMGDLILKYMHRLTQEHKGGECSSRGLTLSPEVEVTIPTGSYDQLRRLSGARGAGAYTTALSLFSLRDVWLPNGRILRLRVNLSWAVSSSVSVKGVSVYDPEEGFRGKAKPGSSRYGKGSLEYSLSRRSVLTFDSTCTYNGNTRVTGRNILAPASTIRSTNLGHSVALALAPAFGYSWANNLGVLVGVRIIPAGHNTAASITPVVAINLGPLGFGHHRAH